MSDFIKDFDQQDSVTFAPGSVIFKAGDPGNYMYVVQAGEVEIWYNWKLLDVLEAGAIFGEMALIDDRPRSATVIARSECRLLAVDKERFVTLVHQTPRFALSVMRVMSERLRDNNETRPSKMW
jgi:CRP-like cAMP-binding protein